MRKSPPYTGACTVYVPPRDCVRKTSVPFSRVTGCPAGIWIASTSRLSSTFYMACLLRTPPSYQAGPLQPAAGRDVGHREHDQDPQPEEAARHHEPDEPAAP